MILHEKGVFFSILQVEGSKLIWNSAKFLCWGVFFEKSKKLFGGIFKTYVHTYVYTNISDWPPGFSILNMED